MRVFISYYESKDSQQKRTKIIDNVRTLIEAKDNIKKEYPNAIITYSNPVSNGTDGTLFGRGMLLIS